MMFRNLVLISLFGAFVQLDVTAFAQVMISRPMVCAPILGALLGDVRMGICIGFLIELIWIKIIPMGSAVPPDVSIVAITATAIQFLCNDNSPQACILSIALAIPFGVFFKKIDIQMRYFNKKVVSLADNYAVKGDIEKIGWLPWLGLLLFFAKAFLFYMIALPVVWWIFKHIMSVIPLEFSIGLRLSYKLLPYLGLAIIFDNFSSKLRKGIFHYVHDVIGRRKKVAGLRLSPYRPASHVDHDLDDMPVLLKAQYDLRLDEIHKILFKFRDLLFYVFGERLAELYMPGRDQNLHRNTPTP